MSQQQQLAAPQGCKSIATFGMKNGHYAQMFRKNDKATTEEIVLNSLRDPEATYLALDGMNVAQMMEDGVQVLKIGTETVVVFWSEVAWFQVVEVPQPSLIKSASSAVPPDMKIVQ